MQASKLIVGVDVPWVTSWTAEEVLGAGPCPTAGGRPAILQRDHAGFGKPQYSMNHYRRQRASIMGLLCPMCGKPTAAEDRWTLVATPTTAGALRARGLGASVPPDVADDRIVLNAGSVSPGHLACMDRSKALCPHLSADAAAVLRRFPPLWYVSLLKTAALDEADGVRSSPIAPPPVVTFLQLCGVTGEHDPKWRKHVRRFSPAAHRRTDARTRLIG